MREHRDSILSETWLFSFMGYVKPIIHLSNIGLYTISLKNHPILNLILMNTNFLFPGTLPRMCTILYIQYFFPCNVWGINRFIYCTEKSGIWFVDTHTDGVSTHCLFVKSHCLSVRIGRGVEAILYRHHRKWDTVLLLDDLGK